MKHIPWDFQQKLYTQTMDLIDSGERSIIIQLATRAGKSIIAALMIEEFAGNRKEPVYFIGHKKILVTQMSDELTENGMKHGIIAPWAPQLKYRVQVISKDTFFNRFKTMKETGWKPPRLIIIDECHMAMGNRYKEIIESYPESIIIGLSATPIRLDGKGLGVLFDKMVTGPAIRELQRKKRLCEIETFAVDFDDSGMHSRGGDYVKSEVLEKVDKPAVLKDLVKHWEQFAKDKKTLTFAASIKHAKDISEEFNNAGYPSISVSSHDSSAEIKNKLNDYYSGKYINLVSIDLFTMGLTVKDCSCILMARPTQSLMVYMQSGGRGMIYKPGKVLIIIDAVNNWKRHGLIDDDRGWDLTAGGKKPKELSTLKKCPACYRPVPVSSRVCPHCGFLWVEVEAVGSRIPEEKSGKLVKIDRNNGLILKVARNAKTLEDAINIAGDQGYKIWTKDLRKKVDRVGVTV